MRSHYDSGQRCQAFWGRRGGSVELFNASHRFWPSPGLRRNLADGMYLSIQSGCIVCFIQYHSHARLIVRDRERAWNVRVLEQLAQPPRPGWRERGLTSLLYVLITGASFDIPAKFADL
jgi:hypothetical protein